LIELREGLLLEPAQPERPAHCPVRSRAVVVGHQTLRGSGVGLLLLSCPPPLVSSATRPTSSQERGRTRGRTCRAGAR